jgi:hypothetical protein
MCRICSLVVHIATEQTLIKFTVTDFTELCLEIQFSLCFAPNNTVQESPSAFLHAFPALRAIYRSENCCENCYVYKNVKRSINLHFPVIFKVLDILNPLAPEFSFKF